MTKRETAKPFELVAGNAALDLVNTVDFRFRAGGSEDLLKNYRNLLRFVTQAGLTSSRIPPGTEAERTQVLEQVKELREALAGLIYAWLDGKEARAADLAILESHFKHASEQCNLRSHGNRLTWRWPRKTYLSTPLWLLEQEAADLLLSDRAELIRSCASDTCRWLFLDTSKNHTRRWCDMKLCGNRVKARNFQARRLKSANYSETKAPARSGKSRLPAAQKRAPAESDRS